jgi:serine/threonine-protein kinase
MGQDVECELCVSAIDARKQELFTCIRLLKSGIETRCKKCDPAASSVTVEIIPADPTVASWRPFIAAIPPIVSTVTVPDVRLRPLAEARVVIQAAGLTVGAITQQSTPGAAPGTVVAQRPGAGTLVAERTAINLVVATAPGNIVVPNLVGLTLSVATNAIKAAGLQLGAVSRQQSTVTPDTVLQQNPPAGQQVPPGSAVSLIVTAAPVNVVVPNIIGLALSLATDAIRASGLQLGVVGRQQSGAAPPDTVIQQNPAAGQQVAPGTSVSLVLATAPDGVVVPDVVGLTLAKATKKINLAGLTIGQVQKQPSNGPAGVVLQQKPVAGERAATGAAVDLVIDER